MVGEQSMNQMDDVDSVFAKLIESIKSSSLCRSSREDRQVVAAWVNKLSGSSSTETEKKNRNLYSQILLKMLRRSQLKKPFTEKPNPGKLPTIPVYMSDYLDETEYFFENVDEPKWLLGSEDSMFLKSFTYENSNEFDVKARPDSLYNRFPTTNAESMDFFQIPEANELEFYLTSHERNIIDNNHDSKEKTAFKESPEAMKDFDNVSLEDDSLLQKFEDIANEIRYPAYKNPSADDITKERALEKKLEFLGKKIEVESTKIQKQQDNMVKNILDRKNSEMNEMKVAYQKKMSELEVVIEARDETILTLNRKLNEVEGSRTVEVRRLEDVLKEKESFTKKTTLYKNEMNEKMNQMNLEMTNLKRCHFENIEKLVAENEKNVAKCEEKFMNENEKLRENLAKLTENIKIIEEVKNTLAKERDDCLLREEECHVCIKQLQEEVIETKNRLHSLDEENLQLANDKQKLEEHVKDMKEDGLKSAKTISTLQLKIKEFKCALDSLESNKQSEVKEMKIRSKEKILDIETSLNKKIFALENDLRSRDDEYESLVRRSSDEVDAKNAEIKCLSNQLTKLMMDAKLLLEKVKKKADMESSEMFEHLNVKFSKLQATLAASKEKLKLQKNSIVRSLDNQRKTYLDYKSHTEHVHSKLLGKHNLDIMHYTEKLAKQKREYEERLKGLLPLHVKRELEDTIESMRQQIEFLQSQTELLQEELVSVAALDQSKRNGFKVTDTSIYNE